MLDETAVNIRIPKSSNQNTNDDNRNPPTNKRVVDAEIFLGTKRPRRQLSPQSTPAIVPPTTQAMKECKITSSHVQVAMPSPVSVSINTTAEADRSSMLNAGHTTASTSALTTTSEDVTRPLREGVTAAAAPAPSIPRGQAKERNSKRVSFHDGQFANLTGKVHTEGGAQAHSGGDCGTNDQSTSEERRRINTVTVCGKNYMILGLLGKGASSVVYRVYDPLSSCTYAYKRVEVRGNGVGATATGDREDDAAQGLFSSYMNEIALLQELKGSTHVVQLEHADVDRERLVISMIMEAGEIDLARALYKKSYDPFFSRTVWKDMLLAVDHLQSHRVVHGDLKPVRLTLHLLSTILVFVTVSEHISSHRQISYSLRDA